jgi:signal transduction histidine kinase
MKLSTRTLLTLIVPLTLIFVVWGIGLYFFLNDVVIDEIDDQLEHTSDLIIRRTLLGYNLSEQSEGSNNTWYLTDIDESYLLHHPLVEYGDSSIYVISEEDREPARYMRTVFRTSDGTPRLLTVITPSYERDEVFHTILTACILLLILTLIVIAGIFLWSFWRNTRPLYRILHWLDDYTLGQHFCPLTVDFNTSEYRRLGETLNDCFRRIESTYEREGRFIGHISHELNTPLSVCQNRLEMLIDSNTFDEAHTLELMKIQEDLSTLIRLNRTLLFLTRVESDRFIEKADINVTDKVTHFLTLYGEVFEQMQIQVTLDVRSPFILHANDELITTLVSNLLRNAFIHNIEGGIIHVTVADECLTVSNTGTPEPLDRQRLFERFFRAENTHKGSTGLGLSIVRSICDVSSLSADYHFANGLHTFVIKKEQ